MRLAERLRAADVEVTLIKAGGHRLSEAPDLDRLTATLDALLRHIDSDKTSETGTRHHG
jgi:hypothetical protein